MLYVVKLRKKLDHRNLTRLSYHSLSG